MPTPTKGPRLGGGPAHQRLMLANLATALFEHGRITTTEAKARRLRPFAEKMITFAKRGDLHARRQVLTVVRDKGVVHTLFDEIGPRYENRPGGYTRITKIGPRKGDNAPMAVIELVEETAEAVTTTRPARTPKTEASTQTETTAQTEATAEAEAAEETVQAGDAAQQPQSADSAAIDTDTADTADTADDIDDADAVDDTDAAAKGDAGGKSGKK